MSGECALINKQLEVKLLRRNGLQVVKDIERRQKCTERSNVVYSTEQAETEKRNIDKNKGCMPCSIEIRGRNSFAPGRLRSGRTKCVERDGKILWSQPFSMRQMKSK